jgi:hypothetical protein
MTVSADAAGPVSCRDGSRTAGFADAGLGLLALLVTTALSIWNHVPILGCARSLALTAMRLRFVSLSVVISLMSLAAPAVAQHEGHGGHSPHPSPPAEERHPKQHAQHPTDPESAPQSIVDLELLRNASGTAWQPEGTRHAALHSEAAGFELMFHTLLFAGYDAQGTDRGDHQPMGVGWLMGMVRRRFASSSLTARVMLSPEPWSAGYRAGGYPLILQTGETFEGQPLRDRQHPHDLFMEIAALYTHGIGDNLALQLYVAPAGEPALGPVAFPHRYSASADPFATLSHHWQDSTHISFGVATVGVVTRWAKLEGSWFNGREPDERRYDLDLRRLDSYSARLSIAPTRGWSAQASYGYLASPEALRPDDSVHRVTASATQDRPFRESGRWATTAAFGANKEGSESLSPSFLLETNLDLDGRNVVFGRVEVLRKSGHDLVLTPELEAEHCWVAGLGLGYLRNFGPVGGFLPGVGARGFAGLVASGVEPFYGTPVPIGGIAFVRVAVATIAHQGPSGSSDNRLTTRSSTRKW